MQELATAPPYATPVLAHRLAVLSGTPPKKSGDVSPPQSTNKDTPSKLRASAPEFSPSGRYQNATPQGTPDKGDKGSATDNLGVAAEMLEATSSKGKDDDPFDSTPINVADANGVGLTDSESNETKGVEMRDYLRFYALRCP